jgi:two-component system, LuxR family, response regulator FixJ
MNRGDTAYIVGNDQAAAGNIEKLLTSVNIEPHIYQSPVDFLRAFSPQKPCCLIIEMRMPKLTGLELLSCLHQRGAYVPTIIVTAYGEVASAVRAMKLGAVEFLEKPVNEELLLECTQHWISINRMEIEQAEKRDATARKLAALSPREREVLNGVLNGLSNKEMARELNVSPKAVELYRSKLMAKMEAPSLAILIRETLCYTLSEKCPHRIRLHSAQADATTANVSEDPFIFNKQFTHQRKNRTSA